MTVDTEFQWTEAAALFDGAAYAEMAAMPTRAQKTIRVTFYLFGGPDAERVIEVLAERQAAGAEVRVLLDRAIGLGPTLPEVLWECRRTFRSLQRHRIPVRRSAKSPWPGSPGGAAISHHKYMVVDDAEALAGGMNVGTLFHRYHDLMLHLRGPIAGNLGRQFDADWQSAGGAEPLTQRHEPAGLEPFSGEQPPLVGPASARVVGTGPGRRTTEAALRQNLRRAESSVCVALCEMGRTAVLDDLIACHQRGVDVRVLLDPQIMASFGPAGILNAGAVEALLRAGIAVRLYAIDRDFIRLHLKMALFDNRSAVAGSTNWTRGGFEWVGETDIELHGGGVIAELSAQFEADWQRSLPASFPTKSAHFLHTLYEKWAQ